MARVACFAQVEWVHRHLLSDRRLATATHNITAFRLPAGPGSPAAADHDDDNEDGAGSCLIALLEGRQAEGIFVMVSRWFGGVELGSARYKHIKDVAKSILDQEGLTRVQPDPCGKRTTRRKR